jgi:hypothetical protein
MLIICVCPKDEKLWLFDSNNFSHKKSISFGRGKNDNCKVDDINKSLEYWYNKNAYNISLDEGNTPKSNASKIEYEYVKLRKSKIDFLEFIDNDMDGLVYDFKIGNKKIQEKVCTLRRQTDNFVSIKKGAGKNKKRPYDEGDNDFYWFNWKDKNTFYVVPEHELICRGFIRKKGENDNDDIKTHISFSLHKKWIDTYKFNYDAINEKKNKQKLVKLLE